jgi:hypothetical protein
MQNESRQREMRLMNAVAGLGGRSAPSLEVDLRLGQVPVIRVSAGAGWLAMLVARVTRISGQRVLALRPTIISAGR